MTTQAQLQGGTEETGLSCVHNERHCPEWRIALWLWGQAVLLEKGKSFICLTNRGNQLFNAVNDSCRVFVLFLMFFSRNMTTELYKLFTINLNIFGHH